MTVGVLKCEIVINARLYFSLKKKNDVHRSKFYPYHKLITDYMKNIVLFSQVIT